MHAYIIEWLSLLGRWAHMVFGIAWIGASFYFVWLDNHLVAPARKEDADSGVGGEIWSVHGGGFYHAQKYRVAPPTLPPKLHWFTWEAYSTWLSGMFLMILLYWYQAEIYLLDPSVSSVSKPFAILIGVATLVVGWFAYDWLCKSKWGSSERTLTSIILLAVIVVAWGLCQLFSGRGAYMHFGAMLGTIMVANVFFVIIPGQRDLVKAKQEGRAPDPIHGITGKQRSVHNTYFTLPVLFVMISNHYAMTYGHEYNWLILIAISIAGAAIRVFFVQRHFGKASVVPLLVAGLLLAAVAAAIAPASRSHGGGSADAVNAEAVLPQVVAVVQQRCLSCHAASPSQPGFASAPKGIVFDTENDILQQAQQIHQQTVVTRAMPIGNLTAITEQERQLIDRWYAAMAN